MSGQWSHGKGDAMRQRSVPWEVWDLNWDLRSKKITREEYDERIDAAWARAKKRGWKPRR